MVFCSCPCRSHGGRLYHGNNVKFQISYLQQIIATQKQEQAQEAYSRIQPSGSNLEVIIPSPPVGTSQTSVPQSNNTSTPPLPASVGSQRFLRPVSIYKRVGISCWLYHQREKQEIEDMLNAVGIPSNQDYSQRVRDFQKKINLPSTGIMDAQTLQALIKKTTVHQASRQLGRKN